MKILLSPPQKSRKKIRGVINKINKNPIRATDFNIFLQNFCIFEVDKAADLNDTKKLKE